MAANTLDYQNSTRTPAKSLGALLMRIAQSKRFRLAARVSLIALCLIAASGYLSAWLCTRACERATAQRLASGLVQYKWQPPVVDPSDTATPAIFADAGLAPLTVSPQDGRGGSSGISVVAVSRARIVAPFCVDVDYQCGSSSEGFRGTHRFYCLFGHIHLRQPEWVQISTE
jgi:hypothetical protein